MGDAEHGHEAGAETSWDKHPSEATGGSAGAQQNWESPACRASAATELRGSIGWLLQVLPACLLSYHLKGPKSNLTLEKLPAAGLNGPPFRLTSQ